MPLAMIIWLGLCGLVGLTWALRHGTLNRAARGNRRLTPDCHPPLGADAPRLTVLVAAKDEQANIETCVRTLVDQDYPNYTIVAVNDRSDDRTGEILDRLQGEFPGKVRAVHVRQLPEGWYGKNNAMRRGVEVADGEWFCFVDADCRQTCRSTLSVAMQEALAGGIDFLSILPLLETKSFWERVIQPVCAAILVIWFNPEKVNDPKSKAAYANGAFMMMNRATYDAIGGHASVRTELNEDMHMALLTKRRGRRLFVVENEGLYLTRMYASFGEAWRGWSRIFFGCFKTFRRLAATFLVVSIVSVLPFVSLVVAIVGYALSQGQATRHWTIALIVTSLVVAVLESVIYRFMKVVRAAPWAWLTYPIGAVLGSGMLVVALRKLMKSGATTWRGTTYRNEPREDAQAGTDKTAAEDPGEPVADVA